MRRTGAALLLAAAIAGCATPSGQRTPAPSLDPLLSFSNPALCEPGPAFSALLAGMTTGDANAGFRPGRVVARPALARRIGRITVRKEDGYWVASAPAAGQWMGLPVVAIHQIFPEGGDPGDFQIEFDAPPDLAEQRLRAAGFPARAGADVPLGEPDGYAHLMTLRPVPGRPGRSLFGCGYS